MALSLIAATGGFALYRTLSAISVENWLRRDNFTRPKGYDELSNQVVDPRNITSRPDNTEIVAREDGPYGLPRNIHDVRGDYQVITYGHTPGLQHNI